MSYSITQSATWTATRVAAVMKSVLDDLLLIVARGFLTSERALKWHADLTYLMEQVALEKFEIQLTPPGGSQLGLHYVVLDSGLFANDPSGSINLYWLPAGTAVNILVSYRSYVPNLVEVRAEMARRGWVTGGAYIGGASQGAQAYGVDGLGVRRGKVGEWK